MYGTTRRRVAPLRRGGLYAEEEAVDAAEEGQGRQDVLGSRATLVSKGPRRRWPAARATSSGERARIGRLRAIRADTSQRAFARQLGVGFQAIQRAEKLGVFGFELLLGLAAWGVRLDWVLLGEGLPTWPGPGLRPWWDRDVVRVRAAAKYL